MSTTESNEDLLEQVLFAYENDIVPEKSLIQFQQDTLGPSFKGRRYQLNPVPLYYKNPKCCCNVKLTICLSILLAVLTTIILLLIFVFAGGSDAQEDASPKILPSSNLTEEHYALMDAVVGKGGKLSRKTSTNTAVPSVVDLRCAYVRCPPLAKCHNGLCKCPAGHVANSTGRCVRTAECDQAKKVCGWNSDCVGLPGNLTCACKSGYEQQPGSLRCVDINECQRTEFQCPANAHCYNVAGTYRCLCNPGYTQSFVENILVCFLPSSFTANTSMSPPVV
ncbi:hypothetical protein RvY_09393 [Ramazzottius varieornatus]|uniref:EGF-like domain-containing protein n=1 Tax=Ramazzottius varieornatus TaxID=947166 RepID=A0A1D1VEP9_RAMVA|nr:hypothetical protein RvY_09393 [Ramazzottius varieornatus]